VIIHVKSKGNENMHRMREEMRLRDQSLRIRNVKNRLEFYQSGLGLIDKRLHEDKRDGLEVHDGVSILIEEERLNST
jgi:catechol-2,3-dioxygenase